MRIHAALHPRLLLPLVLLLLTLLPVAAQAGGLVGKGEIRDAGREAAEKIEEEEGLYANSAAQRRVRVIGNLLARGTKYQEGTVYVFQVLDMDEVNAMALPDGHVYVTRGLLEEVGKNDDMLAAVIAHELGHLAELHTYRRAEKVVTQGLALSLLDSLFGEDIGKHGRLIASLVDSYMTAEYSQDQEIEADKYGIVIAAQAGYEPESMISFLRLLAKDEKKRVLGKYFDSHPRSAKRAELAEAFLAEYNAGAVDINEYTTPGPPAEAFSHKYPRRYVQKTEVAEGER